MKILYMKIEPFEMIVKHQHFVFGSILNSDGAVHKNVIHKPTVEYPFYTIKFQIIYYSDRVAFT